MLGLRWFEMSLNEVTSGTDDIGVTNKGNNRSCFRNPRGRKRFYQFYNNDNGSDVHTFYYRWSEDGKNWSANQEIDQDDVTSFANNIVFDVKIHDTGTLLDVYIVWFHEGSITYHYRKGTIGDTADTITLGTIRTIASSVSHSIAAPMSLAIARTDNARLVVGVCEDQTLHGKDYRDILLLTGSNDGDNPTWANETVVLDSSGSTNNEDNTPHLGLEAFDSSFGDRVLFYARIPQSTLPSAHSWAVWVYTWNGSSLTQETTYTDTGGGTTKGNPISVVIGSDDKVNLFVKGGGAASDHEKFGTAGSVTGSPTNTQIDSVVSGIMIGSMSINRTTNDLYIFYFETSLSNIKYKKSDDTTTSWSTTFEIPTDITITGISSSQRDQVGAIQLAVEE